MTALPDRYVPKSLRPETLKVDPKTIRKVYGIGHIRPDHSVGMMDGPTEDIARMLDCDPSVFQVTMSIIEFTEGKDAEGKTHILSDRELYRWNRGARAWVARAAKPAAKSWNDTAALAIKGAPLGALETLPPAMATNIAKECADAAIAELMKAAGIVDLELAKAKTDIDDMIGIGTNKGRT